MEKEFEKNGLLLLFITIFGSALNYLFQILSGRLLSVSDYGTLTALFSLIAIAIVPAGTFSMYISRNVTLYSLDPSTNGERLLRRSYRGILLLALTVGLLGIAVSPVISRELGVANWIDTAYMFVLVAVLVALSLLTGVLQGRKRFFALGMASLILPLTKMLSIAGIYILGDAHGFAIVFITMILGNSLFFLLTAPYLRRSLKPNAAHDNSVKVYDSKSETGSVQYGSIRYVIAASVVGFALAYITNIDTILIKHFFPSAVAGEYGAAMMFGRVLLYIPTALVLVMFPLIAEKAARGERTLTTYFKTVIYSVALISVAFVIFFLFSSLLIQFLYGARYEGAAQYVVWSMLNIFPISVLTINMNYELAKGKPQVFLVLLILFGVFDSAYAFFFHASINQLLQGMFAINFCCLLCSTGYIIYREPRRHSRTEEFMPK